MPLPWMSRHDRRAWRTATTLADLGHLTARWLEGDLKSRPGYQPRYGPDDETRDLIPTLATCNRAGFLTDQSQPGYDGTGYDGARWQQRAAVQGYINNRDLLERIQGAAVNAGLIVLIHTSGDGDGWRTSSYVPATVREGMPLTSFGGQLTERDIQLSWLGTSSQAIMAATDAHQVALIDPDFNRDDRLWPLLDQITQTTRTQTGV